jgi:hypothetical protein
MASQLTVKGVEKGDEYYHVTYRDSDSFEELRTPDWASKPARSVVPGSEVRMGQDNDEWLVQSVLIPIDGVEDSDDASRKAMEIVTRLTD